ncbi:MAG: tetratricopeptide repeat protein [candidate division NC10 bacterium]|nr:tetratricopeptide repeat protein [candidate division NC10 bacterium]
MLPVALRPMNLRPGQAVLARALFVGLLALLVRLIFVLEFAPQPLFDVNLVPGTDMEFLVRWAQRISGGDLLGRGSGPFWWAPLFPYSLGGVLALVGRSNLLGAAVAQAALGAVTCALLYLVGRRLLDEATGLTAGLLGAVYGPAIFYTGIFVSTTLEVFLALAILLAVTGARERPTFPRWLGAGVVGGLGCLARPNFLLGVAALWGLLPVLLRRPDERLDWSPVRRAAIAFAAGVIFTIAPATARNWAVGGEAVLVSAAGPETFRIANSFDSPPLNFVYPKEPLMPLTSTAFWRHQARKAVLFWWGFEPPQNVSYYLAREHSAVLGLPWLPFWLAVPLAAVGLWATRRHARGLAHLYAFLSMYYLSVVAFFIIARWRLSLIVPLLLFTAAGLLAIFRWIGAREWGRAGAAIAAAATLAVIIHPGPGPFIFAADHGELGYILANRGDYAQAAEHLAQAAAGLQQNGPLHRDLGILLFRLNRLTEARAALERAVTLIPDDAAAHRHLGRLLLGPGGDPDRARVHLARALSLMPNGRGAGEARALLDTLGRGGRAP